MRIELRALRRWRRVWSPARAARDDGGRELIFLENREAAAHRLDRAPCVVPAPPSRAAPLRRTSSRAPCAVLPSRLFIDAAA